MAVYINTSSIDAALSNISSNVTDMALCEGYITSDTFTGPLSGATFTADGNGVTGVLSTQSTGISFTGPQDNAGNRELVVDAQNNAGSGFAVTTNGTGDNVILYNETTDTIYAVTGLQTDRPVTTSDTVSFGSWTITINQAA